MHCTPTTPHQFRLLKSFRRDVEVSVCFHGRVILGQWVHSHSHGRGHGCRSRWKYRARALNFRCGGGCVTAVCLASKACRIYLQLTCTVVDSWLGNAFSITILDSRFSILVTDTASSRASLQLAFSHVIRSGQWTLRIVYSVCFRCCFWPSDTTAVRCIFHPHTGERQIWCLLVPVLYDCYRPVTRGEEE